MKVFRDYFYFQTSDRRAIVALGCIAVFCIGVLLVVDSLKEKTVNSGMKELSKNMKDLQRSSQSATPTIALHAFDPNTIDSLTLVSFGVPSWKVKNFLHYRAAGKVFCSADELGDTYGWTSEDVERLTPFVHVGAQYRKQAERSRFEHPKIITGRAAGREKQEAEESTQPYFSHKFQTLTPVDVNTADTALLRRIPGVGEKISEAIVRYRNRLGGFHSVEQLMDIKIVSPELLAWFTVSSSSSVKKIAINRASFQQLNSHPYITYDQTKDLLQYIHLYGPIPDEPTLVATAIFTPDELERLRPYITYE